MIKNPAIIILLLSVFMTGCNQLPNSLQSASESFSLFKLKNLISVSGNKDDEASNAQPNESEVEILSGEQAVVEETIVVHADLWQRIRGNFQFDLTTPHESSYVQMQRYLKHPHSLERMAKRAEPYLFHIVDEIEKRQLPMELALLPFIESSFDAFAYSHGSAAGIWQIIPSTGKSLGLKQSWWYDGRRDIVASTGAALDYLEQLNKRYDGDWLLTLAAYNSGMGTVSRAIRKNKKQNKPTDYWSLALPGETRVYAPKLVALAQIVMNASSYDVNLPSIKNEAYFTVVDTQGQLDLALAAKMAKIDLELVYRLNPGLNRWATDPEGPHQLAIPVTSQDHFDLALQEIAPEERLRWTRYIIKKNDTLSTIASRYGTTTKHLKTANNLQDNRIVAGRALLIPQQQAGTQDYSLSSYERLKRTQNKKRSNKHKLTYEVKSGDSFWTLSKKFKVPIQSIAKANNLAPKDSLRIGKKLVIWQSTEQLSGQSEAGDSVIRKVHYRVRSGDSLSTIAQKFKVRVSQIQDWNSHTRKEYLQPDQNLTLFVDVKNIN